MATKIGIIAQELSRTNPWWRTSDWEATDPDLRDVRRAGLGYQSDALKDLTSGGLYILRGSRRVGKTVAVKQQISRLIAAGVAPQRIVRVAADGWSVKELRTLVQNTALPRTDSSTHRYWFIDEITAVPGAWDQQIKWLRDNDLSFRDSTVVLTGSNATSLSEAAGTLAGRRGRATHLDRTLLPVGFRTFARLVADETLPDVERVRPSDLRTSAAEDRYRDLLPWLDQLVSLWELYLSHGGYLRSVAAAAERKPVPSDFVEDMFGVVSGDAFRSSKLSVNAEMALLERLWSAMASPANLTKIGGDLNLSHDVAARHVTFLRDSFLLWSCPQRHSSRWIARPRAQDKLYAIDPLVARLPYLRNASRADIDPTVLTEMQVGMALRRSVVAQRPAVESDDFLFHVRTPSRKEIDFVAEPLAGVAVEAKYVEDGNWHSEAATANASEWDGVIVSRNVLDLDSDPSWAVPAGILAYLLDT